MWVPLSCIIQHWVGIFHTVARTALVTAAWNLTPHRRFVVIPAVIVGVYVVTIVILEQRWRAPQRRHSHYAVNAAVLTKAASLRADADSWRAGA